ncbi:MAG: cupin domain-containing protein [Panacagrimonas sp.]
MINPDHTHPFEVRGLVLSGEMRIVGGGKIQHCREGDVFVMRLGEVHKQEVGAAGLHYLYGSR